MNDHEPAWIKNMRNELAVDREKLRKEIFKPKPLHEKIVDCIFSAVLFITICAIGYSAYEILIQVIKHFTKS